MTARWDDAGRLWLVTPEEFARLPDGFTLECIDGSRVVKGRDYIDTDTRFGHMAYGAGREALAEVLK